jgi:tight adherence protein C
VTVVLAALCAAGAFVVAARELRHRRDGLAHLARAAGYGQQAVVAELPQQGFRLPGLAALVGLGWRLVPGRDRATTAERLRAAGFDGRRVDLFLALKVALAVAGAAFGAAAGSGLRAGVLALVLAAFALLVPDLVVSRRIHGRRERMQGELPGALDLLAVIVEAGLGIDAALQRYAANADGPLAEEIRLLAAELRIAGSREEAFARFAERVPFPETKAFVRAVAHSDRLGVSLGASLRAQANEARYRRQQSAEEQANKAPVKMLFPMVLCIFPSLLVVVLAPPILRLLGSL